MFKRTCAHCGSEFSTKNTNKTCSETCKHENSKKYKREWLRRKEGVSEFVKCVMCGIEFNRSGKKECCSKSCEIKRTTKVKMEYYAQNRERIIAYQKETYGKSGKEKKCKWCGIKFTPKDGRKQHCSQMCMKESANKSKRDHQENNRKGKFSCVRACKICGSDFTAYAHNSSLCSSDCRKQNNKIMCTAFSNKRPDVQAKGYIKKYKDYAPDDELINLIAARITLRRAIKKAGE